MQPANRSMAPVARYALLAALSLLLTACGEVRSDRWVWSRLSGVKESSVQSRIKIAESVLVDALSRGYRFSQDSRRAAFAVARRTGSPDLLPLVRTVAEMPVDHTDEGKRFLDLFSIHQALFTLTALGDPASVDLNRQRLFSNLWLVEAGAISNLRVLEDWGSTADVVAMLSRVGDSEVFPTVSEALKFSAASPETSESICAELPPLRVAYRDCFIEELGELRCPGFNTALDALRLRFSCDEQIEVPTTSGKAETVLPECSS